MTAEWGGALCPLPFVVQPRAVAGCGSSAVCLRSGSSGGLVQRFGAQTRRPTEPAGPSGSSLGLRLLGLLWGNNRDLGFANKKKEK